MNRIIRKACVFIDGVWFTVPTLQSYIVLRNMFVNPGSWKSTWKCLKHCIVFEYCFNMSIGEFKDGYSENDRCLKSNRLHVLPGFTPLQCRTAISVVKTVGNYRTFVK